MDSSNRTAELKQPLLDLEDVAIERTQHHRPKNELDVEHHVSSVAVQVEEELEEDRSACSEDFIMWVILPTLLFSQFGMAFLMHDDRTATMSWTIVNLSIVLFVITAWLYRHACHDANIKTIALLLLPEILMDVVLGLVLFDRVALGFMVLLISMLCLSSFVVVSTAIFLYFGKKAETEQTKGKEQSGKMTACQMV